MGSPGRWDAGQQGVQAGDPAVAAQQEIAARHWQAARALAHDLMEGELAGTGQVWGVVLEPGERFISDVQCDYARYYGTQVEYRHSNGFFFGPLPFVVLALGANAIGNASRRSAAQRAAMTQWREFQQVRVIVTDRRLLCQRADGVWLSFYYRGAHALYPEAGNWSLVLDYPETSPVRFGGWGAPIAAVAAVWALYGKDGLRDHPGLAPLRG